MKRFIVLILMALVFSVSMNAQCISQTNQMSQERIKCYQTEMEKSLNQQIAGRNTFLVGLGIQSIGVVLQSVSAQTDNELILIWGAITCIGGTATEIVGLCKWLKGYDKTRKLKIGYVAESGGIGAVVVF